MDVVIISNYWHFPSEKSSSRYNTIAEIVAENGDSAEVITSKFYHTQKKHRAYDSFDVPYKVTLLDERAYKKNVSPARLLAHGEFASNVIKYLSSRNKPDVIYLFVPPAGLAKKVVKFANKNGIRIIIDVLDLWPEAFGMFLPKIVSETLLYPMKKNVEYAYTNADSVIAVSENYVKRAMKCNKKCKEGHCVFIGTDIAAFDKAAENAPELPGKLRPVTMAYIGMLGHSYDLCGVMDAMKLLINQGYDNVELLVMGDGPLREKFEIYAHELDLPVRFTGRLSYEEMAKHLVKCDIGLNVLNCKAVQSIINKHADYVSAGVPVINVQTDKEFSGLLEQYNAGVSCEPEDVTSLARAIQKIADDEGLRAIMGENSRKLAEEKFDRTKTYKEIISVIKGILK